MSFNCLTETLIKARRSQHRSLCPGKTRMCFILYLHFLSTAPLPLCSDKQARNRLLHGKEKKANGGGAFWSFLSQKGSLQKACPKERAGGHKLKSHRHLSLGRKWPSCWVPGFLLLGWSHPQLGQPMSSNIHGQEGSTHMWKALTYFIVLPKVAISLLNVFLKSHHHGEHKTWGHHLPPSPYHVQALSLGRW